MFDEKNILYLKQIVNRHLRMFENHQINVLLNTNHHLIQNNKKNVKKTWQEKSALFFLYQTNVSGFDSIVIFLS
jgi:hypothetical protein